MKAILADLANIVTILGLFFIIWQLRDNRINEKRARTFQLIDRYWLQVNPVFIELLKDSSWLSLYDVGNETGHVMLISYFEELGYLWNHDIIDKKIIKAHLTNPIIVSFNKFSNYIKLFRKDTKNPSYCIAWERMATELKKNESKFDFVNWLKTKNKES